MCLNVQGSHRFCSPRQCRSDVIDRTNASTAHVTTKKKGAAAHVTKMTSAHVARAHTGQYQGGGLVVVVGVVVVVVVRIVVVVGVMVVVIVVVVIIIVMGEIK